jgi:hypothetical protein
MEAIRFNENSFRQTQMLIHLRIRLYLDAESEIHALTDEDITDDKSISSRGWCGGGS